MAENRYDSLDIVRRENLMLAGGMKFAVYRVRYPDADPANDESWSGPQFHMTYTPQIVLKDGHTLVDDGRVVICGMMACDEAIALEEVVNKIVADPKMVSAERPSYHSYRTCLIIASRRRDDDTVEFQIRKDCMVLGIMGFEMAKLFTRLVRMYLDPPTRNKDGSP